MELECYAYAVGHPQDGTCLWVKIGAYGILLDCGLDDPHPVMVGMTEGRPVNAIICSHAHREHAYGLRSLRLALPNRPIYSSQVTAKLLPLNWEEEAATPLLQTYGLNWFTPTEIAPQLWLELFPAGHLPGAAVVQLTYSSGDDRQRILYTGDCLLSNSRLVEGLPLDRLRGARPDVAIIDGNYGTARYARRRAQENEIAEQISHWLGRSATVVLPVSRLGLAQELLAMLRAHHHFTGRNLDIWVDRSIAQVCDIYLDLLDTFPQSVQNFARNQPLFWDERVRPRVRRLDRLKTIAEVRQAARERAQGRSAGLGFGEYATEGTIVVIDDRADFSPYYAALSEPVFLFPHQPDQSPPSLPSYIPSAMYQLSEHCDSAGTTQLIHNLRPQHLILVGRSPNYLADLGNLPELYDRYQVHYPISHRRLVLPLRPSFTAPDTLPIARYEGQVFEQRNQATIELPSPLTADPRWQKLADTGLVELRWQGEDLVIRGLAASEVLDPGRRGISLEAECCANCIHCRGQQCRNPDSPLQGRRVSPEGHCPVFEAVESEF